MNPFLKVKRDILTQLANLYQQIDLKKLEMEKHFSNLTSQFEKELAFNLLCLGDFSSGKSTFINRFLIKEDILTTRATTTTARLCSIKYGEKVKLVVHGKSGDVEYDDEAIKDAIERAGAKDGNQLDEVLWLELFLPSENLKNGIMIVDSPGLNDPEVERSRITTEYMNNSDCILYFLNANQAWKRSEKEFLEEKVLSKKDFNKIFFLLNYWDMLEEDHDRHDVIEHVKKELRKSMDVVRVNFQGQDGMLEDPEIQPISCKTKENFDILEKKLWDYLSDKSGKNLLNLKVKKIYTFIDSISERQKDFLLVYQKTIDEIEIEIETLKNDVAAFHKEIEAFKAKLYKRVERKWDLFIANLQQEFKILASNICMGIERSAHDLGWFSTKHDVEKMISQKIKRILYLKQDTIKENEKKFLGDCNQIVQSLKSELNLRSIALVDLSIDNVSINYDNLTIETDDSIIWLSSVAMLGSALILGLVTAPLVGLVSPVFLYLGERLHHKKVADNIIDRLPEIKKELDKVFTGCLNKIEAHQPEFYNTLFENTRNEIIDLYIEKESLYESALRKKKEHSASAVIEAIKKSNDELNVVRDNIKNIVTEFNRS